MDQLMCNDMYFRLKHLKHCFLAFQVAIKMAFNKNIALSSLLVPEWS